MAKAVAVVETFTNAMQDVWQQAEQQFSDNLATYRAGVRAMAESGGTLPPGEANKLLAASQALGVSPERLADDAAVFIHIRSIEARIEAVNTRNAERKQPLPRLQQELEAAKAEWSQVRVECEQRLKAAQDAVTQKERAVSAIVGMRDERAEDEQAQVRTLHDRNPHLFGSITADQLRRMLAPAAPVRLW